MRALNKQHVCDACNVPQERMLATVSRYILFLPSSVCCRSSINGQHYGRRGDVTNLTADEFTNSEPATSHSEAQQPSPKRQQTSSSAQRAGRVNGRSESAQQPHSHTGREGQCCEMVTRLQVSACCVCMDAPREACIFPCGHVALCYDCAETLANAAREKTPDSSANTCPICRKRIENIARLYFA